MYVVYFVRAPESPQYLLHLKVIILYLVVHSTYFMYVVESLKVHAQPSEESFKFTLRLFFSCTAALADCVVGLCAHWGPI